MTEKGAGSAQTARPRRALIAAVSPSGAIGIDGTIPWHYTADLRRFKRLTAGKTVIMGRRTFESMGEKPLPNRRNIVITRRKYDGVETFVSIEDALLACGDDEVWFIGGAEIYREAMAYADLIDLTYVPDEITAPGAVFFPPISPDAWEPGPRTPDEVDGRLEHQEFRRRES